MIGKQFINGEWIIGEGEQFYSLNQANLKTLWEGANASPSQIEQATRAARVALWKWKKLDVTDRFKYIQKFTKILEKNKQEFIEAIAKEVGKPLWEAEIEVNSMLNKAQLADEAYKERCPQREEKLGNETAIVRHKPHGVVAIFSPFNFPGQVTNAQVIPALLAGNTIILKPSEHAPFVVELLVSYWIKAGLPNGVLNLLQGGKEVGISLAEHPNLDGIFFVGSAEVGLKIQETILKYPGRIIALEMGGNNPLIVHEIDDIMAAVYVTIQSAFITAGQRCTCARRLIVTKSKQNEEFVEKLLEAVSKIKVGTYLQEEKKDSEELEDTEKSEDTEPFMGPLISNLALTNVLDKVSELVNLGSKVLAPINRIDPNKPLVTPGVIDVTNIENRIDEEIFGPVLKLIWVNDLDEAIVEANCTAYGLAAGILTKNKEDYELFLNRIRAGLVNWNRPLTGSSLKSPFGGRGISGNSRPAGYYSVDYCAYPVSSIEANKLEIPKNLPPGLGLC